MRLLLVVLLSVVASWNVAAQTYVISTFAGKGLPIMNAPGPHSSLVGPTSVAVDSNGNVFFTDGENIVMRLDAKTNSLTLAAGNGTVGFSGDNGPATSAQLNNPQGVAVDSAGNLYIADLGNNRIRKVSNGVITTIAGGDGNGFSGDGGLATSAYLYGPGGVAVDFAGNLYIADTGNQRIRKVTSGVITTVAGSGTAGFSGDNGPATSARLNGPCGVAVDFAGNLYIADTDNQRIRKVANGVITTVSGSGTAGFSGDNGAATGAQVNGPCAVAVDSAGNLYIADADNHRIREVSNGMITTIAGVSQGFGGDNGPAASARMNYPRGIAVGAVGNLYIADQGNNRIRRVSDGLITTVGGNGTAGLSGDNGPAARAQLVTGQGIAVDTAGNLYIADNLNDRVRKIANGVITTVAGNGTRGFSGDNGSALLAQLNNPGDIAVDAAGNLYIADTDNARIRKVANGVITTVAGNGTNGFSGDNGPATSAQLSNPSGIALDTAGNLYIADGNYRIREVTNGVITTVAGNGTAGFSGDDGAATSAQLNFQCCVTVDSAGNLYIADTYNNRIRRITNGVITTVAGNGTYGFAGDNGPAIGAQLSNPYGVSVDNAGNLYIADTYNNRIRKITNNVITTIAGGGSVWGDGGPATSAELNFPTGSAVDAAGNIYIADRHNLRIRLLTEAALALQAITTKTSANVPFGAAPFSITASDSAFYTLTVAVSPSNSGTVTINPAAAGNIYTPGSTVCLTAAPAAGQIFTGWTGTALDAAGCLTMNVNASVTANFEANPISATSALRFVPVTPCRLVDTRNPAGPLGGPSIAAGGTRSFTIQGTCSIPSTALAYSLNLTVVPQGTLGYVSMWPTGQSQPVVSTLNSLDGRIKSNAAIVPAGTGGAVSVFATDATDAILDINGYFDSYTDTSALQFYPLTPCRVADTRSATGSLGGPSLVGKQSRSFPIMSSACGIPGNALAYSLNFTAIPQGPLGYLTVWPSGQSQPVVSTLNAPTGAITANAAIVPAGTGGAIQLFATDSSDMAIDINGYFAAPAIGGLSLYNLTPCRIEDTRNPSGTPAFTGTIAVTGTGVPCGVPPEAQALVLNATVVPSGALGYISLWANGGSRPVVSTLNALDGSVTSNMAVVPTTNGLVNAYAAGATYLILDTSGYFAPPPLAITSTSLSAGVAGSVYSATVAASGGTPPYTFSAGGLPDGLSISSNGQITGTPSTAGTSQVAVTVTDSASSPATATATISLTISAAPTPYLTVTGTTVGQNLQTNIAVSLNNFVGSTNITISSDNSSVLLAKLPGTVGSQSITVVGATTSFFLYVQGLANSGTATITAHATALGAVDGTAVVTLAPSAFVLSGPNGVGGSVLSNEGVTIPMSVIATQLDSSGNPGQTQQLAAGLTQIVTLSNTNSAAGVVPASVTFTAGTDTVGFNFVGGTTVASTVVTVKEPTGFSTPSQNANVIAVTVQATQLTPSNVTVGKNLEAAAQVVLSAGVSSDLVVTLTSSDSTKVLLSTDPTLPGTSSITMTVKAPSNHTQEFYVYGLASSGTSGYTATATGFGTTTGLVTLAPSGFVLEGPYGIGQDFITVTGGYPTSVNVDSALLNASGNYVQEQALAGGQTANVAVTSSLSSVGTVGSPVTITGGNYTAATQFTALGPGTTLLSAVAPTGFSTPQYSSLHATVNSPNILIDTGNNIGMNLELQGTIFLGASAPSSGASVVLTVTAGKVLLSPTATGSGSTSITVTIPAGQFIGTYYMYGQDTVGSATITATSAGYNGGSGVENLTPSGVVIYGPNGLGYPLSASVSAGNTSVNVSTAQLDASDNFVQMQPLAPISNNPLQASLNSSVPTVGTIASPAIIPVGSSTATVQFTPLKTGSTVISAPTPSGFTAPAAGATLDVTVGN